MAQQDSLLNMSAIADLLLHLADEYENSAAAQGEFLSLDELGVSDVSTTTNISGSSGSIG